MSMTREEAAHILEYSRIVSENFTQEAVTATYVMALAALRGPTREQVEKMRGEWEWFDETVGTPIDGYEREWGWQCSKCKTVLPDEFDNPDDSPAMRFCQWCGAPMTDKAVDMVMERLEALGYGKDD